MIVWSALRVCYVRPAAQDLRKSRQQTKKLERWVAAQKEFDAAEQAMKELPEDSDRKENLVRAKQLLGPSSTRSQTSN
jgi:hypothetical protein